MKKVYAIFIFSCITSIICAQNNCFDNEILNPGSFSPYDSSLTNSPEVFLNSTFFVDSINGFIAGFDWKHKKSIILATNDGGNSWKNNTLNLGIDLQAVYFIDQQNGFAVGSIPSTMQGYIIHTIDGGTNWNIVVQNDNSLFSINFLSSTIGFIGGSNGTILKTVDSGANWNPISSGSSSYIFSVYIKEDSVVYAMPAGNNSIRKSIDKGITWNIDSIPYPQEISINKFYFLNSKIGFALASGYRFNLILKTEDSGSTWKRSFIKNDLVLKDVSFFDNNNGIVVGEWGTILTTEDGGNSWNRCYSVQDSYTNSGFGLNSSYMLNDHSLLTVGEAGAILRFNLSSVQTQTTTAVQNTSVPVCDFRIYPNPAKESLNVELNQEDNYRLKIFTSQGLELRVFDFKEKETNINLINIPSGFYFISLSNGREAYSKKIIIE